MEIPHYEHKYITLFNNEESYWNKETSFEEVNYSAIKTELTDNSKRNYQPSIRTTNKDNEYIMNYWKSDVMRGKFFLEIIWGYFGWEWKDYNKMIDSGTPAICTFQVFNREPAIYLALSADGVITSSEPYELTMEENEDGTFYLTDGTYYVGLAGTNNYDLSSDPTKKAKITIETTEGGQVYLKENKGYIGHNPATDNNKFYADKPKQSIYSFIKTKVGGIDPTYITYTGGNLYKVKEIETVRSIIDGYRLQHINDFLNSQDKVTTIEPFDVSNILAMNRAFKRIEVHKNGGRIYWNARTPLTLKIYDFPNVVEADELFKGSILTEGTYNLPSVESIDQLYSFSVINENSQFKFQLDNLNELTDCFAYTRFKEPVVNLNRFFTGNTLNKVKNLTGMCLNSTFRATDNVVDQEITVNLDLMQHEPLAEGEAIDMTRLFKDAGIDINNNTLLGTLHVNLDYKDSVIMDEAFYRILARYGAYTLTLENKETVIGYNKRGFKYLDINFTPEKINLITSLKETFRYNTFETKAPINFCPANCDDSSIYENCTFNNGVDYDFSPSHEVKKGIGQFRNTTINGEFNFQNVDALKTVDFSNMKFDTPKPFPYILDNPNYEYNEDGSRYRDICFANTGITEIPNQDIYIKYYRNGNQNTPMRLFQGCSYFKPTKDIHIYIEDRLLANSGNHDSPFMLFEGCSEMVETPTVHWNHSYKFDNNVGFIFNGCVKLERINFLHVVRVDSYFDQNPPSMSLSADIVPSLIYLELGNYTGSIDLSKQKNLDIPTLTDTLMRQSRTKKFGTLYININIWNALSQETRDHCISIYKAINIDEY